MYTKQLTLLKIAKMAGCKAPHKPILLLSVIDLIERCATTSNQIESNEALESGFTTYDNYWNYYTTIGNIKHIYHENKPTCRAKCSVAKIYS